MSWLEGALSHLPLASVRWRVTLAISGVVLLCTGVCVAAAVLFLRQVLTDRAHSELHQTLVGVSGYLASQSSDLRGTAKLIADDPTVRQAVVENARQALVVHLTPYYADLNTDVLDVVDSRAHMLVRMEDTLAWGDAVINRPSVYAAFEGRSVVVPEQDLPSHEAAGGYALRATVPIRYGGRIVGAVVVGRQLDSVFAARIGHALDANVNLIAGDQRTGTTLTDANGLPATGLAEPQDVLDRIATGKPSIDTVLDHGRSELSGVVPIRGADGFPAAAVEVVRPLDPIYDVVRLLSLLLLALGAVVVVVGTVLGLDIARRLTQRLSVLEGVASRAATLADAQILVDEADLGTVAHGRDEVASLARSFAAMMKALNDRMGTNARLYASAEARLRELNGLAEIARLLTAAPSLHDTLDLLGEHVCRLVGASGVAIWLPGSGSLPALMGGHDLPPDYEALSAHALKEAHDSGFETAAQMALRLGEVCFRRLGDEGPRGPAQQALNQILHQRGWRSATAVPLRVQDRTAGALTAYSVSEVPLTHSDLSLLITIADQVAVAVENARLADEAQTRAVLEERLQAQEVIRASEIRYRTMVEQSPLSIQIYSPDGTLIQANSACERLFGMTVDDLREYNLLEDAQLEGAGVLSLVRRAFAGESVVLPALKYVPQAGNAAAPANCLWVQTFIYPVKAESGAVREIVLMHEDITEQRLAEAQVREKESQYREVFEATGDALIVVAQDGTIVEANRAACAMHGWTYTEFVGRALQQFIHPDSTRVVEGAVDAVAAGVPFEAQALALRRDGPPFSVEIHGSGFTYRGRGHLLFVLRDITERVAAYELLEQRVAERTKELSTLLDVSHNVASTLELAPLLRVILDQLKTLVQHTEAAVMIVEDGTLRIVGSGLVEETHRRLTERAWPTLERGEPVIINDVMVEAAEVSLHDISGPVPPARARSWMAVPLLLRDQTIGALSLTSDQPDCYMSGQMALVMAIGDQAAVAIENARLYRQAQEAAVLEERQRLARELHDSVSQALYGIALGARTARTLAEDNPHAAIEPLDYVLSLAEAGLSEMRALIFELRPETLESEGLVAALEKQITAMRSRHGLQVQAQIGPEPQVPLPIKEALYRIAQEALHNTVKHASAHSVDVGLSTTAREIVLDVRDDGKGFDLERSFPGHLGLHTMRERAVRWGGTCAIQSAPGVGTHVQVRMPAVKERRVGSIAG